MSRKFVLNLDYSLIQGLYWMFYVVTGIYVSVYMLGKGYSNTVIGIVIALGNILSVLLQGLIADITDRNRNITNITVIKVLLAVMFVLTAGVFAVGSRSALLTVIYTALIVVHTGMHPFVNALSFTLGESGEYVSFGIARSMGSLFAAVMGLAMGYMVTGMGVDIIPFSGVIMLVFMEIVIICTGRHYRHMCMEKPAHAALPSEAKAEDTVSFAEFIRGNRTFVILGAGVVCLFFGNVILENFTIQIVESIGGNTEKMGIVIFVMAMLEMPAMLFFDRLKKHFSYVLLIRVAAVFFAVKIIMMYLADSMTMIYIAQINQMMGYGLMFPAMVGFIDDIMSEGEAVRGQAVFTTAITVGSVLGCIAGGRILDLYTVKILLLISSCITVMETALISVTVNRIRPSER